MEVSRRSPQSWDSASREKACSNATLLGAWSLEKWLFGAGILTLQREVPVAGALFQRELMGLVLVEEQPQTRATCVAGTSSCCEVKT